MPIGVPANFAATLGSLQPPRTACALVESGRTTAGLEKVRQITVLALRGKDPAAFPCSYCSQRLPEPKLEYMFATVKELRERLSQAKFLGNGLTIAQIPKVIRDSSTG